MKTGIELIAKERKRQVDQEGWTADHDKQHSEGQLAIAASCYCLPDGKREYRVRDQWPFDYEWWKPSPENRIKELVKAGALIAAEIDRLQNETVLEMPEHEIKYWFLKSKYKLAIINKLIPDSYTPGLPDMKNYLAFLKEVEKRGLFRELQNLVDKFRELQNWIDEF